MLLVILECNCVSQARLCKLSSLKFQAKEIVPFLRYPGHEGTISAREIFKKLQRYYIEVHALPVG